MLSYDAVREMQPAVKKLLESEDISGEIGRQIQARDTIISTKQRAGALSDSEKKKHKKIKALFEEMGRKAATSDKPSADYVKEVYNGFVRSVGESAEKEKDRLRHMFDFIERAFGAEENEMLVAVTELTLSDAPARFFNTFGSEDYDKYNALLMVADRKEDLRKEIDKLV
jgi:hypothetical protein